MIKLKILPLAALMMTSLVALHGGEGGGLRCENLANPPGIDVTQPRLSWVMASTQRGKRQTAYQILVASSPERLKQNQGDCWDSGKVASDQSIQIQYTGQPLSSRQPCFWKVCVWDKADKPHWNKSAQWTMGLLQPDDWRAKWMCLDEFVTSSALSEAQ